MAIGLWAELILDSSLYTGSITYVDVTENSQYWEIPMQSELSPVTREIANIRLDGTRHLHLFRLKQHGSSRYWNHIDWRPSINHRIDLRRHPRFRKDDGRIRELLPIPMYLYHRLDHHFRILSNRNWRCRFQFRPIFK